MTALVVVVVTVVTTMIMTTTTTLRDYDYDYDYDYDSLSLRPSAILTLTTTTHGPHTHTGPLMIGFQLLLVTSRATFCSLIRPALIMDRIGAGAINSVCVDRNRTAHKWKSLCARHSQ